MINAKLKADLDLNKILSNFEDIGDFYVLTTEFDEYISISKKSRKVIQNGYNGLMLEWASKGYLESF